MDFNCNEYSELRKKISEFKDIMGSDSVEEYERNGQIEIFFKKGEKFQASITIQIRTFAMPPDFYYFQARKIIYE